MNLRRSLPLASALAVLCALLLAPPALAAPSRQFDTQITGPPEFAKVKFPGPFRQPLAITTDSADNLWVSDYIEVGATTWVDKLTPAGGLLAQTEQTATYGLNPLAFDATSNLLYADAGGLIEIYNPDATRNSGLDRAYALPSIAFDNSSGPYAGSLYATEQEYFHGGPDEEQTVRRLDATGHPAAPFTASAPYISANKLTGTPSRSFDVEGGRIRFIAVDNEGNIYALNNFGFAAYEIDEFRSTGEFVRTFTGAGGPVDFSEEAQVTSLAVDPTNGNLLVVARGNFGGSTMTVEVFDPAGNFLEQLPEPPGGLLFASSIAVNSQGYVYLVDPSARVVNVYTPSNIPLPKITYGPVQEPTHVSGRLTATIDPNGGSPVASCRFEYGLTSTYGLGSVPCSPDPAASNFTEPTEVSAEISALTAETTYHYRVVTGNADRSRYGLDQTYTPENVAGVTTDPATEVEATAADLNGSLNPAGLDTTYRFQYLNESAFKAHGYEAAISVPVPDASAGSTPGEAPVSPLQITGLSPGVSYRYRLVAANTYGVTAASSEQIFTTFRPPSIDSFSSSHVTATSAELNARINPQRSETECYFEYGTTPEYGSTVPCEEAISGSVAQPLSVAISGLAPGITYHFRVVAKNKWGSLTSEDQTFQFFPPDCPNAVVRQQTASAYLPDCRAYELVSPRDAGGTLLFPGGPNTGQATNPSRLSFTGAFGSLPGTHTINTAGDLYSSTRTTSGWQTHYIGLPGDQAGCMGGPPNDPRAGMPDLESPTFRTNTVPADPSLSRYLIWTDGAPLTCLATGVLVESNWAVAPPSNAPYLFDSDGTLSRRLPTNLGQVPGDLANFKCPYPHANFWPGLCHTETAASPDLTHLAFSSYQLEYAEGGQTAAPGSAYDNDLHANTVSLISKLPNGQPIPQDPSFATAPPYLEPRGSDVLALGGKGEYIRFPAISTDGSHILMSTATKITPRCLSGEGPKEEFNKNPTLGCERYTDQPLHLYMRVGGGPGLTYEITPGRAVKYLGMTPDGTKLFFTSKEQLTPEDKDTSADLYMWSEEGEKEGHPLTLLSKGDNGGEAGEPGNADNCSASWTAKCGVEPYSGWSYSWLPGGAGGNGISDSGVAANGDIYFYSPEQLDGDKGALEQHNLYVYRHGAVQFVTTLDTGSYCTRARGFISELGKENTGTIATEPENFVCSDGPIVRFEVTPNDTHVAFVTASRLTSYDNAGHLEMYTYAPATGALVCASCRPDGRPPTADVQASLDGLFLTNDGRAFFSTSDPLVPQDTNAGGDVYEYVEGRPQLITPGTGAVTGRSENLIQLAGLAGVSADGTDVYFSTFDKLVNEDRNGNFLKFYDARTGGGFAEPAPAQPCAAAEECHGPGTEPPGLPTQGTASLLSGGNVKAGPHKRRHRKHRKASARRRHARVPGHGAAK